MNITELRLGLLDRGYIPLPITSPDAPVQGCGQGASSGEVADHRDHARRNQELGAYATDRRPTPGCAADTCSGWTSTSGTAALVNTLLDLASDTIGATPLMRIGQAPKTLLAYRTDAPFTKIKTPRLLMPDGQPALIECLATGQQFVGFGIHPGTRQPYHWPHASPLDVPLSELPAVTEAQARAFVAEAERLLRAAGGRPETKDAPADEAPRSRAPRPASAWPPPTHQDVADALKAVPNNVDWHWWVKIGAALFDALADDGEDLFIAWSAQSSKDDPEVHPPQVAQLPQVADDHHRRVAVLAGAAERMAAGFRNARSNPSHRKETARSAFQLLRRGVASTELLAALHEQNRKRPDPLPAGVVDETAIWAARQAMERAHAQ